VSKATGFQKGTFSDPLEGASINSAPAKHPIPSNKTKRNRIPMLRQAVLLVLSSFCFMPQIVAWGYTGNLVSLVRYPCDQTDKHSSFYIQATMWLDILLKRF
jgi:hypothetical protein